MFHGQASVDVKPGHDVGLAGLGVLQALRDEGRAPFGQQQELLYALEGRRRTQKTWELCFWKLVGEALAFVFKRAFYTPVPGVCGGVLDVSSLLVSLLFIVAVNECYAPPLYTEHMQRATLTNSVQCQYWIFSIFLALL